MKAKALVSQDRSLENEKANLKSRWEEVVTFFLPGHGSVYGNEEVGEDKFYAIDRTGCEALRDFTAGIYSHTINLSTQWFTFRVSEPDLSKNQEVQDAFTEAAKSLYRLLQNSNLEQSLQQFFTHMGAFGTGIIYSDIVDDKFRFNCYSPAFVNLAENEHGIIDKVFRSFEYTAKQAYDRWGDECPETIRNDAKDPSGERQNNKYKFLHVVCPREKRNQESLSALNMPWASYYIVKDDCAIVEESGYETFPYHIARFYRYDNDSPWGQSPAMAHVDTMRMVNRVSSDIAEFTEAMLFPPLFSDDQEAVEDNKLSMKPRRISYYQSTNGNPPFQIAPQGNIQPALLFLQQYQKVIRDAFFSDLFIQESDNPNMTATEVMERKTERLSRIAPVVVQVETEAYAAMIERCLGLAISKGWVERFPDQLADSEYQIHYTSRLSSMLSRNEMQSTMQGFMEVATIAESLTSFPYLNEIVDVDKMAEEILESYNVDPEILRSEKEREEYRAAIKEQQEQAQQAEAQSNMMKPIDPGKAPEQGSPLEELQEAVGG